MSPYSTQILAKNPGMAFGEVGKALGAAWGKLSDAEKVLLQGSEWQTTEWSSDFCISPPENYTSSSKQAGYAGKGLKAPANTSSLRAPPKKSKPAAAKPKSTGKPAAVKIKKKLVAKHNA